MIDKPWEDINAEDLERLRANGVSESRSLDYKQALPGSTDDERKEFFADVTAFANTAGGDLIYGVVEGRDEHGRANGVPDKIDGLAGTSPDVDIQRFENMLRDGIAPRLPSVQYKWVAGFPLGPVLIIRVARSWAGPHMVTFKQHSRFYARSANGKHPLDVFQLRHAFLGSGSLRERAREFRAERLGRILGGETPVTLDGTSLVCVHVVPHVALAGGTDVDMTVVQKERSNLEPLASLSSSAAFNLDGFVTFSPWENGRSGSYLQVFRNGVLEAVTTGLVGHRAPDKLLVLHRLRFADELSEFLNVARRLMVALAVEPPASVFVSILGVREAQLSISDRLRFHRNIEATPFDRNNLLIRDLLLTEWDGRDTRSILRPLLDEVWQASGFSHCFDYDKEGNWKPAK